MRLRIVPVLSLIAALMWGTAGWTLYGWRAVQPALTKLRAEVQALERRVAQLEPLPAAPRLVPIEALLPAFLSAVPSTAALKIAAASGGPGKPKGAAVALAGPGQQTDLLTGIAPVRDVAGATQLDLTLRLPQIPPAALAPALTELERWPARWPVELAAVLWESRTNTLALALVFYGASPLRPGGRHGPT